MATAVEITTGEFRSRFPVFNNETTHTEDTIQAMLNTAVLYISPKPNRYVDECTLKQMIYLMAAHLTVQNNNAAAGNIEGGLVQSASVGGVSVSKALPRAATNNNFDYWLTQSIYGQQLLALIKLQANVGIYIGGTPENVFR